MAKKLRMGSNTPKTAANDYEQLGRLIENTYLSGALDRKRLFITNLLRGISFGIGSVIGATVMIALLLWTLSRLQEVPFVGPVFEALERTVEEKPSSAD